MRHRQLKAGERVSLLKVTLRDHQGRVRGNAYRVLAVPETLSLYSLAAAIIDSFDFDFDHAFGFYDNLKNWTHAQEGYELFTDMGESTGFKSTRRTPIKTAFNEVGKKMLFLFDYGEEWTFQVELLVSQNGKPGSHYPELVQKFGSTPPQYPPYDENEDEN